ncbi:uncharacterized protein LOC144638970 [Oculina patagonica]
MTNVSSPSPSTKSFYPENEECHYLNDGSVWRQSFLTDDTYPQLIAVTVVNFLAVIPAILLNALVILAVTTRHQLRTKYNILVACLAGADLLAALVGQPLAIAVELKRILSDGPFCSLEKAFSVALFGFAFISLGSLVLMSIDRYVSVKHPLRYRTTVTTKRIKTGLLLVWAFGLLVTIQELVLAVIDTGTELYLQYLKVKNVILTIFASFCTAVIAYTYCYIFSQTRRQRKRLQTEQLSEEERKRLKKENKSAITLTIILVVLVLTCIPAIILAVVVHYADNIQPHNISILWSWISTFGQLGILFDPIIFFWRVKKLRRAILEIVHYRQPENSPPPIEMMEIKRYRPEIKPTTCEAFSVALVRQEPVLVSFRQLEDGERIHLEEETDIEETAV